MPIIDDINRAWRDFTGWNALNPLPVGDPTSGVYYPSKGEIRQVLVAMLQATGNPEALDDLITQINAKADRANSGKMFGSRAGAVSVGQEALPASLGRIITLESGYLVYRAENAVADDPLFPTAPSWGVVLRVPGSALLDAKADLANTGKMFGSRVSAVNAGQGGLPAALGRIITLESGYLVYRAPTVETDDPLFPSSPFWGAVLRVPGSALLDGKAGIANSGKMFGSREGAVAVGQGGLPAVLGRIITLESGYLVYRAENAVADDPLFPTAPSWGAVLRVPGSALLDGKAGIANSGKMFGSREGAVAVGQGGLPAVLGRIITLESGYLVYRADNAVADDPLFGTAPTWGVVLRVPGSALLDAKANQTDLGALQASAQANQPVIDRSRLITSQTYRMPPGLGLVDAVAVPQDDGLAVIAALTDRGGQIDSGSRERRDAALPPGLGLTRATLSGDLRVLDASPSGDGAWFAAPDAQGTRQIMWSEGLVSRQVTYGPEDKDPLDGHGMMVRATVAGQPVRGRARRMGPALSDTATVRLVIVYGQSLALGHNGIGAQFGAWWTIPPSPSVLMLSSGLSPMQDNHNVTLDAAALGTLVPAASASSIPPQNNNDTAALPLALAVQEDHGGLVAAVALGRGGTRLDGLSKGSTPYANILAWVTRAVSQVQAQYPGRAVRVQAVALCHGEADADLTVAAYTALRDQLFSDLTSDITAVTGQAGAPVFLVGQTATLSAGAALASAYAAGDGVHVCYGPQYGIGPYVDASHMAPRGYSDLGVQMGLAYQNRSRDQRLRPISATRYGTDVVVEFAVPVGRLIVDPRIVDDGRLGLSFRDSTSSARILSARIVGDKTVLARLSAVPTGASPVIGIADRGTGNPGTASGARSPLCDQSNNCNPITGGWMPNRAIAAEIAIN